jgi:hypothetical protein
VIGASSSLHLRLAAGLLCVFMAGCSSQSGTPAQPDPGALLQAIPSADAAKCERIRDMKNWRNPYLIIRADGVALLDSGDNAEIILRNDEVLGALARLPASDWPYGRVVAAAENGVRASEQDGVAIRRNKGIVGGMLQGAHVAVKWVPGR